MDIYVVKQGDSVDSIAKSYNIPTETLLWDNQIEYPYRLAVGQALYISDGNTVEGRKLLYTSGYAYPFINEEVLEETLPYLDGMKVFSYGFTLEGELIPPISDDAWMIGRAQQWGTRPILTLTPLGEDGHFNNNLVSALVRSHELQQRIIWELGRTMQDKGFGGLDIDFEYVLADDREGFAAFVGLATRVMNLFGYPVSVALAPKTSAEQRGLLYEGIDYALLGSAANRAMLMTYEWGYSQGPPMAVAPINMVRRVVDYAVTAIPRDKLSLGIPNYGYDWALPYERGVTRAKTINNHEAVQLAIDFGVDIRFDETAMSPYFRYWQYGVQHEVWFEDVRSIKAKFDLIREYGLSGAGYWQLMSLFRANWLMLNEMFYIEREWPVMERLDGADGT
ncbi:glycosyl hydrolase family 18 protein [Enterocloster sp. OA13]|uniref:glycosyl hydrolase family 18 protein n=1 Tax=Enterocloster TaxID=2719313 RepID=UPI000471311F|nr:glycosyl hydrolase family 18 protein [Lachnoclostridium pacaense]MCC2820447.1 LysM peptidoglycan-binding domain-containing protein [Lachnoclostridium pacaense]MCH1948622.1 glycosyl hydrolase family 18 protein [Enterocloster sp. OA13]